MRALTVKLRGRTEAPARRRRRTLSPGARGAKQEAPHGPLQRLLEVSRSIGTSNLGSHAHRGSHHAASRR